MELDDLKNTWRNDNYAAMNPNLKAFMGQKDNGPIVRLKRNFIVRLVVGGIVTCNLAYKNCTLYNNDILMWVFIGFCCLLDIYYYYSYNLLDDLQSFYKPVSETIKEQINILQRGAVFFRLIMQGLPIIFAVVLEVLMYYHQEPFFANWYMLPPKFRVLCYCALFLLFYALKRYTHERYFDRHILHLKEMARQL